MRAVFCIGWMVGMVADPPMPAAEAPKDAAKPSDAAKANDATESGDAKKNAKDTAKPAVEPPSPAENRAWMQDYYSTPLAYQAVVPAPPGQALGWFGAAELEFAGVALKLRQPGQVAGFGSGLPLSPFSPVQLLLPNVSLGFAAIPNLAVGYRFDAGAGELVAHVRSVWATGQAAANVDPLGPSTVRTKLALTALDFDYVSPEFLGVGNDIARQYLRSLKLLVGMRTAWDEFDIHADSAAGSAVGRGSFAGWGPHGGFDWRPPVFPGSPNGPINFYVRGDFAGLAGIEWQNFTLAGPPGGTTILPRANNGVATGSLEFGLAWAPCPRTWEWSLGYRAERWWNLGRNDTNNAELTVQGVALRGEWHY